MRFVLEAEQQDMADTLRSLLTTADVPAIARSWVDGDGEEWRKLWQSLGDLGVTGLTLPEERGGLGLGTVELTVCLQEFGYAGLPGPVVESLALLPALLPDLTADTVVRTAVVEPHVPCALDADLADEVYACGPGASRRLTGLSLQRTDSFDPARRLFEVAAAGGEDVPGADFERGFDLAVLGCAAYLLGLGHRMLDLATEHVTHRQQFGRPVGEFQAVKHHLANALLKLEFARPLIRGAALAADTAHAGRDASAAKLAAGEAAHLTARTALQVHGAIGYTAEHDLHRFLTKTAALRQSWGTPAWHRRRIAAALSTDPETPIGSP
ncbi:acyl-CoA dehydrogenase [Saccharopolyspora rhizosphaerae]|uniref:Acyl-CoA dehydrogenase n=1 Tax=Saccharopolyspora rhizosphaerae TaxID=2492662 RepID=A0A3R8P6T0_9PSEU|nr:acyl-CoA dehydrogenase family protein [Saccharopolyspora rhizosphaerae]RRO17575.1 acyl-CoA dehydrogenase [Saccharopolyspora rhizosphaerae]